LKDIVAAAILAADPPKAMDDAEQAAAGAGVFLEPETVHGYQTLIINAAAGDVKALHDSLNLIARAMKILGDPRTHEQRQAAAAGIIADPQTALDLIARAEQVRQAQRESRRRETCGRPSGGAGDRVHPALPDDARPAVPFRVRHLSLVLPPVQGDPGRHPPIAS
jgi:hypothetical protein